ncbi:GLC7-interacting protein 3 [Wickerhamomyces ciferrii]|uniref:GLC7-interacting protein 3 n=1 Tax=Wickerhamomyces ciferrii (strain ATCC 14091 / BCRC 22168 / CBS 111 / JCM 3599 / NBRC 0793 / NRRL Y-1031 F-60-10) TaxID=1206466 RepID=K0KMQ5_WICCF|nr:GLC7-interacting protein 3 [Wickerhamomyces ciferrii]CCH44236.1 GLC7-interacting protein 3 [Wickerhamomyces ciferrii]
MTSIHEDASSLNVDWFYRGKKKSTKKSNGNGISNNGQNGQNGSSIKDKISLNTAVNGSNGSLIPSPTISNDSAIQKPTSSSSTNSNSNSNSTPHIGNQGDVNNTINHHEHHRSILSNEIKNRPRSASDSSKLKPPSSSSSNLSNGAPLSSSSSKRSISSSLKRSNSLNEHNHHQQTTPQTQPQAPTKPKKSIFSAFSKLKSSKSNVQSQPQSTPVQVQQISRPKSPEPISIPSTPKSMPTTPKSLPSSIDSISPNSAFLLNSIHRSPKQSQQQQQQQSQNQERIILNKNPNRSSLPISNLSNIKLRRVTFALDKLPDDPPQQIPSRRPKRGNVIVVEDLIAGPSKLNVGITNESQTLEHGKKYDEKELKLVMESQRRALEESDKHAQEAHFAAKRIAHEVKNFKLLKKNEKATIEDEIEEEIETDANNVEIDKPIHLHEHHYEEDPKDHQLTNIPLELIYTRCCHLREILPIPATLKQLKNKHSPLSVLKMLNPKPTLIDVYSFSDFIAIVPIKTLILDNVTMNSEMLKILLSSLINSTTIEKISLKNVPLDIIAWKFLCKFLSRNKSLLKLDISQMKIKSELPISQHRSQMDWSLFIDTLYYRGGLQELILNGCKIPHLEFMQLIDQGISLQTKRLGLVSMELNYEQIKKISNLITDPNSKIEGIDLGFNDLSIDGKLKPLIKKLANCENSNLESLSFNSTMLDNVEDVALLIRSVSKLPNLRFLDLSNLKNIFPGIMPYLNKYLPRFPALQRLHLDSNELSSQSFGILSGIIPKCSHLIHLSIMNQSSISYAAAATIYSAIKSSKTIVNLDVDFDLIDDKISSRIAVCLMRNMQRTMHGDDDHHLDSHDDILFDGSLIAETASKLLEKFQTNEIENDEFSKKFLKKKFLNKINESRLNINKTIDELLTKQEQKLLSLQEKEDLLRFYFLDNSLLKILEIFQNLNDDGSTTTSQPTSSISNSANISTNQGSNNLINSAIVTGQDVQPHQMVTELNEGKETPIDVATGKPILLRSVSQTSIQAKKQEEEEGEFHRWGFFVQQQRQLYPNDQPIQSSNLLRPEPQHVKPQLQSQPEDQPQTQPQTQPQSQTEGQPESHPQGQPQGQQCTVNKQDLSSWAKLPSGEELRDAVIKAKGINSITDLIDNVNDHRFNLEKIYPTIKESLKESKDLNSINNSSNVTSGYSSSIGGTIDSDLESQDGIQSVEVDEVYDKLLNSLQRVRSNK